MVTGFSKSEIQQYEENFLKAWIATRRKRPGQSALPADLEALERKTRRDRMDNLANRIAHIALTTDVRSAMAARLTYYTDGPGLKLGGGEGDERW